MTDPMRLRDPRSGATPTLRRLLDAGRSETPGSERLRGVASRLGLTASAVPGASGPLAKGGAAGLGHAGVAKLGAVVLILGAGTGALAMRDRGGPVASTVVASRPENTVLRRGFPDSLREARSDRILRPLPRCCM